MSDKLSNRSNLNHPFDIPDETAIIRGSSESGIKKKWENVYHPEEIDSEDFVSPKGRTGGGGEGGIDLLFDDPDNADPELRHLYGKFLQEKYHLKLDEAHGLSAREIPEWKLKAQFGEWLDEGDQEKSGKSVTLHLTLKSLDDPDAEKTSHALRNIWGDTNAKATYLMDKTPGGRGDKLIFESKTLGEADENRFEIGAGAFNDLLKGDGIRMRVDRPGGSNDRHAVMGVLKNLKIGDTVFKGNRFAVKYPDGKKEGGGKVEVFNKHTYDLKLNQRALDRLTKDAVGDEAIKEAKRIEGAVKDFWGTWVYGPNEIEAIAFGIANDKIVSVIMKLKDRSSDIVIPAFAARPTLGLGQFSHKGGDTVTGFRLIAADGREAHIDPHTPAKRSGRELKGRPDVLSLIMKNVRLDGIALPKETRYYFTDADRSWQREYVPRQKSSVEVGA